MQQERVAGRPISKVMENRPRQAFGLIIVKARFAFLILLALLVFSGSSLARVIAIDLRDGSDLRIVGASRPGAAGDVNADGIPDFLIAGRLEGDARQGRVWVIFGRRPMPTKLRLSEPWTDGFLITGAKPDDQASEARAAGDVNGDGFDDIIVGASGADNNGRSSSGSAYVVFGKSSTEPVELSAFDSSSQGDAGFRIDGAADRDLLGDEVDGLGDLNGDGLDDVGVASPFAAGVYVVFGKRDAMPVDLLTFDLALAGGRGFRIDTAAASASGGVTVAGPGDVNGDALPDVLVGVVPSDTATGSGFLVFGKSDPASVDVRDRGDWGFRMKGALPGEAVGYAVSGGGDVNGDGLEDLLIGAPDPYRGGVGGAYVVFGKSTTDQVVLCSRCLEGEGFKIRGPFPHEDTLGATAGASLDDVGDVNDDGLADFILSADMADNNGRLRSGSLYVVYGKRGSRMVDLTTLGARRGFRIDGARAYHGLGDAAGVGDINGDGIPDVMGGASGFGGEPRFGLNDPGATYLVYGPKQ